MGRQLVIFLDGTGNRFSHKPTNVIRLLRVLPKDRENVLTYYDQGVGTFGVKETLFEWQKLPSRICGLAFGWGLKRNVEGAYHFLAKNYRQGDNIYLFGFSRGAYAARALAALIHTAGIVEGYQAHLFDYAWAMLLARTGEEHKPDFKLQARFKSTFGRRVNVHFLGLFDTVKSVGWIYDPVIIPYTAKNPAVDIVRHAVSIDERRCFFRQHLWRRDDDVKTDLKEVWFAGVHSDVGGGYPPPQSQLALMTFRWMLGEAWRAGLRIDFSRAKKELSIRMSGFPAVHDSMLLGWKFAEWLPRLVWTGEDHQRELKIGAMPPFGQPVPRPMTGVISVHESVVNLMNANPDYRPPNLPRYYSIEGDDPGMASLF
ncbi:DUF2235 domain-containing protein [Citrobacter farmeri]|uniref:phospholipase effector Tle1 domain-containing protein n=1 Tax=Citrobacter farmeri TaxID=67824 RepID=UPI0019063F5E|nr:DUF2235 domain-containing protein [Citrobacter farmeri]EKV7296598.1 DUF2235 domain-containing protein [Citrobacter farmeri]MBJ8745295.1 DUF2235 domain-containing protein [Citrobacter farmeri]MBJ8758170.1 DUF2235 domain-containing protein [Citrobacter farmeri]MBJ9016792.1 DUF2235 domain-containing protein [Citrobacter farmeri]